MAGVRGTVTELLLRGGVDLAEITRIVLDAAVPGLADAASVLAVDRVLRGGEPAQDGGITVRRLGTRVKDERQETVRENFPVGGVTVFPDGSPCARCVHDDEPQFFPWQDGGSPIRGGARKVLPLSSSVLAVPMTAGGVTSGFLAFARRPGEPAFTEDDVAEARQLATAAGAGVASAVALLKQKAISDTLQHSLMAVEPKVPPGIDAAARCLPADGEVVGGDWYDMFPLPGGRSGIIVGDVMGHGPQAAAAMAHLRSAAHALVQYDPEPADFLSRLDQTTGMLRDSTMATCVYAVLDPENRACTLATAGHVPPVLAIPDGTAYAPGLPPGRLLGLGPATYSQTTINLPPGAVLALYTDGLVENRTRSIDQGILALTSALARQGDDLEAACDELVAELAQRHEDDVTVVLARCNSLKRRTRTTSTAS